MTVGPVPRTVAFKPGERNVFFHLLTNCNLSCRHCYINPAQHGTTMLSKDAALEWLQILARPEQDSNLILLGGEPTLHPDLPLIIRAAKAMGHAVTVDSNGFLFHDFLARISPDELDFLSFSLDGPSPAVNDPIRGKNVFAVCTENVRKAVALGFRTSLIFTASAMNIDHLPRMPALLAELGVGRFFVQVVGLRGRSAEEAGKNSCLQVEPRHWQEVVPETARQAAAAGIHVVYPKVFLEPEDDFSCAGRTAENYFVFPNGRVYRCPLCEDHPLHSFCMEDGRLIRRSGLHEERFFDLNIPEGCVMNRLLQPDNIDYLPDGRPRHRISCCMLKQEIRPEPRQAGSKSPD